MVDGESGGGSQAKDAREKDDFVFQNPGALFRELLISKPDTVKAEVAPAETEKTAAVIVEEQAGEYLDNLNLPVSDQKVFNNSGGNTCNAIVSLELPPSKSSKFDPQNVWLSQLHSALSSLCCSVAADVDTTDSTDGCEATVEGSSSELKINKPCPKFRELLQNNSGVGTLFSNFLQSAGTFKIDRSTPTIYSSDDDVD